MDKIEQRIAREFNGQAQKRAHAIARHFMQNSHQPGLEERLFDMPVPGLYGKRIMEYGASGEAQCQFVMLNAGTLIAECVHA